MSDARSMLQMVRGKEPLDGLCNAKQITPEACDWLKFAVDPFHDMQLDNLKGFPDVSTEPTVIVKVRQALELSAPAGLTPGANWDCHIVLSPVDYMHDPYESATKRGGNNWYVANAVPQGSPTDGAGRVICRHVSSDSDLGGRTARMDGLLINSVPAGGAGGADSTFTPLHCPPAASGGYALNQINLDNFLDFDKSDLGVYRVLYSGFEVVNTTAQIKKQGAVTVYEYGNSYEQAAAHTTFQGEIAAPPAPPFADNGTITADRPCTWFRCPPNNIAEAKIMPGSHTWAASDGTYNTAKFQTDNPFQAITQRNVVISQNQPEATDVSYGYGESNSPGVYAGGSFASSGFQSRLVGSGAGAYYESLAATTHLSRMNTTGAYFTGLSYDTTLFITWRIGIERLPAANKPTFLALAQPSAAFDPNALVLYNLICAELPPGVPQNYNDFGRWFQMVSSAARKAIPFAYPIFPAMQAILTALGRPVLAGMAGAAGDLVLRSQGSKSAPPTPRKKNPQGPRIVILPKGPNGNGGKGKQRQLALENFGQPNGQRGMGVQQFNQMATGQRRRA